MRTTVSDSLKKYLLGARTSALSGVIASIRSDMISLLSDYMTLDGDIKINADIDEITGDVLFGIKFAATEIYDSGDVLR